MMLPRLIIICLLFAPIAVLHAQESDESHILVTFADPGMSNSARTGPSRPGYARRSSSYLVSVTVRRAANRVAKEFGLEVVDEWPIVPLRVHCLVYAVPKEASLEALLQQLRERPEVESAQRMNTFDVSNAKDDALDDPFTKLQHNLDTLELIQAHAWSRGEGSKITIIDTGADIEHPELVTQIHDYEDFVDDSGKSFAADAHGTAIAGVIGAASQNGIGMTGVAPAAEITVLRACWYGGSQSKAMCNSFTLAKAITHALESNTDIINLSLGGPSDDLLSRLLTVVQESGILVVAAAPAASRSGFPSDVPGVIVVGSSPTADAASIATLFAPGEEILVPVPGGGFDYASGSSLSAAHVSGVVALLIAERPKLQTEDVNRLLVASRSAEGASVNACRALAQLLQRSGCRGEAAARSGT